MLNRLVLATCLLASVGSLSGCNGCVEKTPSTRDAGTQRDGGVTTGDAYTWPQGTLLAASDLPLDRLCEAITSGSNRYMLFFTYSLAAGMAGFDPLATVQSCGGSVEERTYDYIGGSPELLKTECIPDAPTWPRALGTRIRASEQAGRARYDGVRALSCLRQGRQFFDEHGGLFGVFSAAQDAGGYDALATEEACSDWLVGLVATGGDCQEHWECGAEQHCKRRVDGCAGTCAAYVATGNSCDAFDLCADSGDCENEICVAPPPGTDAGIALQGQRCGELDAGEWVCDDGLTCDDQGFCRPLPGDGQACAGGACADSLRCGPGTFDGGVCGPPRPAGQLCTGHSTACELCSPCSASSTDGGPEYCRAYRGQEQTCGPDVGSCLPGLSCVRGQCRPLAELDGICYVDVDDEALQGTCLSVQNFCQGAVDDGQGTCALRSAEGQSCEALGLPLSLRGSCMGSYVYCARSGATATTGTCTRQPLQGQACAERHDLSASCREPEPASMFSSSLRCSGVDGGAGTCQQGTPPAQPGDPCQYSSSCPAGYFCDDTSSTCVQAPGLGEDCGSSSDYTCRDARCDYVQGDAGWGYSCVPFLSVGEVCGYSGDDDCGPDLRCAALGDGAYACATKAGVGQACESVTDCQAGLDCVSGVCVAGGVCPREACGGCSDASSLTSLLFFAAVLAFSTRRRRIG